MKKNVGSIDKVIRYVLALLFVVLYFTNVVSGTLGIVLLVLAAVFVFTAAIGFCPIHYVLKINTTKKTT